jgi:hypothetical protein
MTGEVALGLVLIVGAGVLGGVVAFGAWSLLPDTWRPARWPVAIVAGLMTALNLMSLSSRSPEESLLRNPDTRELARAWRDADPAGFSAFAQHVRDITDGSAGGSPSISLALAVNDRLPRLSDADIVALERNTRDLLLLYADANPSLCPALIQGRASPSDRAAMRETLQQSAPLRHQRLALIANAFRADPNQPASSMTDDERRSALIAIGAKLRQNFSADDMLLLGRGATIAGREKRYCEVMAAYEDALASAPDPGRLYRALVQVRRTSL